MHTLRDNHPGGRRGRCEPCTPLPCPPNTSGNVSLYNSGLAGSPGDFPSPPPTDNFQRVVSMASTFRREECSPTPAPSPTHWPKSAKWLLKKGDCRVGPTDRRFSLAQARETNPGPLEENPMDGVFLGRGAEYSEFMALDRNSRVTGELILPPPDIVAAPPPPGPACLNLAPPLEKKRCHGNWWEMSKCHWRVHTRAVGVGWAPGGGTEWPRVPTSAGGSFPR